MKEIVLTNSDEVALVDDSDFESVIQFSWDLGSDGYAYRYVSVKEHGTKGRYFRQTLHIFLLGKRVGFEIDHTNTIKLDCKRGNLRWATRSQNHANNKKRTGTTSKFKGVSWEKRDQKWLAQITVNGRNARLGTFTDEVEAAKFRDRAAIKAFGTFARLNFSSPQPNQH